MGREPILGLMGAPGSGKSTVAGLFAAEGCGIVDADALARGAVEEPGVRDTLLRWWGKKIFNEKGGVDRAAVGRIVFEDADQRRRLESLIHPRVGEGRRALHAKYHSDPQICAIVEDCPLLLETGLDAECDVLILVEASREVRLERVRASRGWDDAELARRENAQLPLDTRRKRADHCIDNNGTPEAAADQVRRILDMCRQPIRTSVDPGPSTRGRPPKHTAD